MKRRSRATPPGFPDDMRQRLELLGRFTLDPMGSGIKSDIYTTCVVPFVEYIKAGRAEQEAFLRDLHALVATDGGGFATYGAAGLMWELFGEKALEMPAALPLIDAGIEFKLARGLPPAAILTGYEKRRFLQWPDRRREPVS